MCTVGDRLQRSKSVQQWFGGGGSAVREGLHRWCFIVFNYPAESRRKVFLPFRGWFLLHPRRRGPGTAHRTLPPDPLIIRDHPHDTPCCSSHNTDATRSRRLLTCTVAAVQRAADRSVREDTSPDQARDRKTTRNFPILRGHSYSTTTSNAHSCRGNGRWPQSLDDYRESSEKRQRHWAPFLIETTFNNSSDMLLVRRFINHITFTITFFS